MFKMLKYGFKTNIINYVYKMKFDINCSLSYETYAPTVFILNIQPIISENQTIISEDIKISENLNCIPFEYLGFRYLKISVPTDFSFTISYNALVNVDHFLFEKKDLKEIKDFPNFPPDVLPYLYPSRHCESDKLVLFAKKEFGKIETIFSKVIAINDWVHNAIDYNYGTTTSSTSACDTIIQCQGVCKDFAHLAIAFCRALDIPARYFTAYACGLIPPDIHACFEAYINGNWILFDPTKLASLNGMVKIAHGKDATEAAVASYFGEAYCTSMEISCLPNNGNFIPHKTVKNKIVGFAYL
jgi:transglutaminase-like putative cysteine protease